MAQRNLTNLTIVYVAFVLTVFASCKQINTIESTRAYAAKIAELQCQSRLFTKQKFLLANEFTTLDNELISKQISAKKADSTRLALNYRKESLLNQSQVVSDSLLHYLRRIWKEKYPSKGDRAVLDSLTEQELLRICKLPSP
ncbi:MAG: hypothetical protein ACOH2A_08665 [Sphingobacteriaceae bacterium]